MAKEVRRASRTAGRGSSSRADETAKSIVEAGEGEGEDDEAAPAERRRLASQCSLQGRN